MEKKKKKKKKKKEGVDGSLFIDPGTPKCMSV